MVAELLPVLFYLFVFDIDGLEFVASPWALKAPFHLLKSFRFFRDG